MINLTQRHIITIIDLLKKEEEALSTRGISLEPGSLTIENWKEKDNVKVNPKVDHLKEIREMLESEMAKATFTFGLNERIQSLSD